MKSDDAVSVHPESPLCECFVDTIPELEGHDSFCPQGQREELLRDHAFQMAVWKYSIQGDKANRLACIAEGSELVVAFGWPVWDQTESDLATIELRDETGWRKSPPLWWALPAVTEFVLKREAA